MAGTNDAGARILAAQLRHCEEMGAAVATARRSGALPAELADLEAQELAARKRYQELSVDMPARRGGQGGSMPAGRRPWWRIW